jgi:hypothetical protein
VHWMYGLANVCENMSLCFEMLCMKNFVMEILDCYSIVLVNKGYRSHRILL